MRAPLTSAGAQRAAVLLDFYDPDDSTASARIVRLLADLDDYCRETDRSPISTLAIYGHMRAIERKPREDRLREVLDAEVERRFGGYATDIATIPPSPAERGARP